MGGNGSDWRTANARNPSEFTFVYGPDVEDRVGCVGDRRDSDRLFDEEEEMIYQKFEKIKERWSSAQSTRKCNGICKNAYEDVAYLISEIDRKDEDIERIRHALEQWVEIADDLQQRVNEMIIKNDEAE